MRDPKDVGIAKLARHTFSKKGADLTGADIRVLHGVVYLRGSLTLDKGNAPPGVPIRKIVQDASDYLRQKGVKDIVIDVLYRE